MCVCVCAVLCVCTWQEWLVRCAVVPFLPCLLKCNFIGGRILSPFFISAVGCGGVCLVEKETLVVHFSLLFGSPRAMAACCRVPTGLHFFAYCWQVIYFTFSVCCFFDELWKLCIVTRAAGLLQLLQHLEFCAVSHSLMCKVFSLQAKVYWLQALECSFVV